MAVVERKVGVASGDGMRLKAASSHPPPAGTYPPSPTQPAIGKSYQEGGIGRGYRAGAGDSCGARRGGVSRARLERNRRRGGIGWRYQVAAGDCEIIRAEC